MGHNAQFIAGPAMTALGAGLTATGAGAGIGPALIASGIGETAGGTSGGVLGAGVGGALSSSPAISKLVPMIAPAMQALGLNQGQQQPQPANPQMGGQRAQMPQMQPASMPLQPVQSAGAMYRPPQQMPPQVAAMLGLA